ncbi:MAG: redoxin domain-containing protein [Terrimonas sp.]|nr:redoxin domain-containing protein [Terrimonas sp.]
MIKNILASICLLSQCVVFCQGDLSTAKIKTLAGETIDFRTLAGQSDQPVIVSFWATWCVPCIQELEAIQAKYDQLQQNQTFRFIAISVDDARTSARVKPFVAGKGWPFEIFLDPNNELKRAFNINDIPHVLVIRKGKVIYQRSGYTPGSEDELFLHLNDEQKDNITGQLSGSFESYTQWYQEDTKINATLPADRIGSNNFLKLDYGYKQFSAGIQFESYLPSIPQFFDQFTILNESKLVNKYFRYATKNFSVQAGDFYEQFGSGLVFRSWENRQIGINNALEGANIFIQPLRFVKIKAVYGRQRKLFEHANSNVRGVDAEIALTGNKKETESHTRVALGGSYVTRYQEYTGPVTDFPATVKASALRLDIAGTAGAISLEYVHKGSDPHDINGYTYSNGNALLLNSSYAKNNLGVNLIFRGMKNMDFRGERDAMGSKLPVNFIPALTKQHDYLTTNIYVYNAQSMGETGGQFELFYNFKEGTALGGKQGSKIAFNFSQYRGLNSDSSLVGFAGEKYFQDMSLEWKKKWNDQWNSTLSLHSIFYNKSVVEGGSYDNVKAAMVVLNTTYQFAKEKSFRFELQHLSTRQDHGNWAAAVTEFSFASQWIFYLTDLYNYGETDIHYPNLGAVFTKSGSRFSLGYGRQRAGLFCVGGVCRSVPATSGFTATLTTTFNN